MLVTAAPQGGELRLGINSAHLRGIGDVDHAGQNHVLRAVVLGQYGFHQFRRQLAVGSKHVADLVAGGLNGAGFVGVDVSCVGADHCLIRRQQSGYHHLIGLGAADQKVHVRLGSFA